MAGKIRAVGRATVFITWLCVAMFSVASEAEGLFGTCACAGTIANHSADTNPPNWRFELSELLRVIQLFNAQAYHGEPGFAEDGFAAGVGDTATGCHHDADYRGESGMQPDAKIDLSELLRVVQLYNYGGFRRAPVGVGTEDGFDLGASENPFVVHRTIAGQPVDNVLALTLTIPRPVSAPKELTIAERLPVGLTFEAAIYTPADAAPSSAPVKGATSLKFQWDFGAGSPPVYPESIRYTVKLSPGFQPSKTTLIDGSFSVLYGDCRYGHETAPENVFRPVIQLNGSASDVLECNSGAYLDPRATVTDPLEGVVTHLMRTELIGFPLQHPGDVGYIRYQATNLRGIQAVPVVRKVAMRDSTPPQLLVNHGALAAALESLPDVQPTESGYRLASATPCAPQIPDFLTLEVDGAGPIFTALDGCTDSEVIALRQLTSICDGVVTVIIEAQDDAGNRSRHEEYLQLSTVDFSTPISCTQKPNVLMVILDDLNDWVGYLGGHPDAHTPNLDRLAAIGRPFMRAYGAGPLSNVSRTALFTGLNPSTTGIYTAFGRWYHKDNELGAAVLPKRFAAAGYQTYASGKIWFPYSEPALLFGRARWCQETHDAYDFDGATCPVGWPTPCIRNYASQADEPFPIASAPALNPYWGTQSDSCLSNLGDTMVTAEAIDYLEAMSPASPFFLTVGIHRPHVPLFVPRRYLCRFKNVHLPAPLGYLTPEQLTRVAGAGRPASPCGAPFPGLESSASNPPCDLSGQTTRYPCAFCDCTFNTDAPVLPPCPGNVPAGAPCDSGCQNATAYTAENELPYGYTVDDILYDTSDLPSLAVEGTTPDAHQRIVREQQWCNGVRAYLASTALADDLLGALLDKLEATGQIHNTIVVVMGDHGWHLGEKQHWQKSALWERTTHTPLIIKTPCQAEPGIAAEAPVSLVDLYPTLAELCGLTAPQAFDGISLTNILEDPEAPRNHNVLATTSEPVIMSYVSCGGADGVHPIHAVRDERYRYIEYDKNDPTQAELYNMLNDPFEIRNLLRRDGVSAEEQKIVNRLKASIPANAAAPFCCIDNANCGTPQCVSEKPQCYDKSLREDLPVLQWMLDME